MKARTILCASALLFGGCATAPKPLLGEFADLTPDQAAQAGSSGAQVRWGGSIIAVEPKADVTCFEILSRELGTRGRPLPSDRSDGRFLACRSGFYDPAVFTRDRLVTVTGRVEGIDVRKVGDFDYSYPRVAADVVYLWPEERAYTDRYMYRSPFYPPHYWWWWGNYRPWPLLSAEREVKETPKQPNR